jgi:hypothetical protein
VRALSPLRLFFVAFSDLLATAIADPIEIRRSGSIEALASSIINTIDARSLLL